MPKYRVAFRKIVPAETTELTADNFQDAAVRCLEEMTALSARQGEYEIISVTRIPELL